MKKILTVMAIFATVISGYSQEIKKDSSSKEEKPKGFLGKERGGAVCVNGLEKLEVAYGTDNSLVFVNQLHFYGPWITEGRIFTTAEKEFDGKHSTHFLESTFDLTIKEFPVHIGYTIGTDQIGHKPSVSYSGWNSSIYWSDIKFVDKYLHIFRTSISSLNFSQHLQSFSGEDSTISLGKKLEYNVFFQLQPIHLGKKKELTLFSEGLVRLREKESVAEFEIGFRHEKIFNEMIGVGFRLGAENFHYYHYGMALRFNIGNPNPKHI